MGLEQVGVVFLGALAGGIVNGLTGFGAGITALGLWLYVISPSVASSLAIICATASQLQTFPMIRRTIQWERALPLIVPGIIGVPIGTLLLAQIEPKYFKIGIGCFLIAYSAYVLTRQREMKSVWGGRIADGLVGFGGGVLGGLAGLSGVLPVVWTDFRGWTKEQRRGVVQAFNLSILTIALASHAVSGLLTRQVALVTVVALPATIAGAWLGYLIYRRITDRSYQRAVMVLLFLSGVVLIWTSW